MNAVEKRRTLLLLVIGAIALIGLALLAEEAHRQAVPTPEQVAAQKAAAEKEAAYLAEWAKTPAGQLCAKHPDWKPNDCDRLQNKSIWLGMTESMLEYDRGLPDHVSVSNYGSGNSFQYCWYDATPSCWYDNDGDGTLDQYN